MNTVAVYCGANAGNIPIFTEETKKLGKILAENGVKVLFGGGSVGLMGVLADSMLAHNGQITGIITHQLDNLELGHAGIEEMYRVATMSERKTMLLADTDGVITLPGGFGSMDELFEALTLAQLHQYPYPIGLLNLIGYYDPLLAMLDQMVKYGFLREQNRNLLVDAPTIEELLEKMKHFKSNAIQKWV